MENWSLEQIRLNQLEIYNMVINRIQSLLGMNLGYYHDVLHRFNFLLQIQIRLHRL